MISRVSAGRSGDGLRMVIYSKVVSLYIYLYVDFTDGRGWELGLDCEWLTGLVWENRGWIV